MTASQTVQEGLRRAFAPTQRGIVGLTDQMLAACVGSDVEFERFGHRCVCRWTLNGNTEEAGVPLPPAAFRTILARIAVLCNERIPDSVTPYGGKGLLAVTGHPATVFQVGFFNTPEKQQLKLKSLGMEVLIAVETKPVLDSPHVQAWRPGGLPHEKLGFRDRL